MNPLDRTQIISHSQAGREYAMTNPPSNPLELLQRLKQVADNNSLLRNSFYMARNLEYILGGQDIARTDISATERRIYVSHLGNLFENSLKFTGIGADIYIKTEHVGRRHGESEAIIEAKMVIDTGYDSRLTAKLVESVFGGRYETVRGEDRAVMTATHLLGNKSIRYYTSNRKAFSTVGFSYNNDGTVRTLSIIQTERH